MRDASRTEGLSRWWVPPAVFAVLAAISGCGLLSSERTTIRGKVKLSDNPKTGHGGVTVALCDRRATTEQDGSFNLEVSYTVPHNLPLCFLMTGYRDTSISLSLQMSSDSVTNIGEVVLHRIPQSFTDNFNDGNADGWGLDSSASYRVEGGEFSIAGPNDGYQHWARHDFAPGTGFLLEARVKLVAGASSVVYGIGLVDTSNAPTALSLNDHQQYSLSWYSGGVWHTIQDWTASRAIDTLSGHWNRLKMEGVGTSISVCVNDTLLGTWTAPGLGKVDAAGLFIQGDVHAHFDDVKAETGP